jgi:uncharacterized damage-inducible protein DinB
MKSNHFFAVVFFMFGFITMSHAQSTAEDLVKDWERAKAYTKEYLDAMPADKYGLKPTPEMRSFADQMLHLTDGNFGIAAAAAGIQSPVGMGASEKSTDKSKEAVTKQVMDSYDFVISTLKNMKPAQMSESVKLFDRFVLTRSQAMSKVFEHQTHHRGQATVYIRLAGATPPQEKLF